MEKEKIKVFFKDKNDNVFRKILSKDQYKLNEFGQIILPKDHYSKGYIERIIDGIEWESCPLYDPNKE